MGVEPVPDDTPIDLEDLPYEAQVAVSIYNMLSADIAEFSGTYLGKSMGELSFYFDMYDITERDEQRIYFRLIKFLDVEETNDALKEKQRRDASKPKKKGV